MRPAESLVMSTALQAALNFMEETHTAQQAVQYQH